MGAGMWVNRALFDQILADNRRQQQEIGELRSLHAHAIGFREASAVQKSKDDVTIDWMRHRINALEKLNAQLLQKAAGILVPIPEIVPTRPGTMSEIPDFPTMPSFEDVGDEEAIRLGLEHDAVGALQFKK